MIKMIVSDLDNTLLRDDKTVSKETIKVIKTCQQRGLYFVPATARPLRKLRELGIYDCLPFDALIYLNGSRIEMNEKLIYHVGLSRQEVMSFLPELLVRLPHHRITLEVDDGVYANHHVEEVDPLQERYVYTEDFRCLPDCMIDRVIVEVANRNEIELIKAILPEGVYAQGVSDAPICRILHKDVSKANALDYLGRELGIDAFEMVVFGDDENDIEMFQYAKTSVAMANAIDDIKTIATKITSTNQQDGVAEWLKRNVLNNKSEK